jgi:hypothetical protein
MCDYSLEMYASRPARESEKYMTIRRSASLRGALALQCPVIAQPQSVSNMIRF